MTNSADVPLKPNIGVSIIAGNDIIITSHSFNVSVRKRKKVYGVRKGLVDGTVRLFEPSLIPTDWLIQPLNPGPSFFGQRGSTCRTDTKHPSSFTKLFLLLLKFEWHK